MTSSPRSLAITAEKGGVGKTTSTANIGSAWAMDNPSMRGLLIDLDPQGNLSRALKDHVLREGRGTAVSLLNSAMDDPTVRLTSEDVTVLDINGVELDILTSGGKPLGRVEERLVVQAGGERMLRRLLTDHHYDWVMFDTRPSDGRLTMNGLVAANSVVAVMNPAAWSAEGGEKATASVDDLISLGLSEAVFLGSLMCRVPSGVRVIRDQIMEDLEAVNAVLFEPYIPERVGTLTSEYIGSPSVLSEPKSDMSVAYRQVAKELWAATGPAALKVVSG